MPCRTTTEPASVRQEGDSAACGFGLGLATSRVRICDRPRGRQALERCRRRSLSCHRYRTTMTNTRARSREESALCNAINQCWRVTWHEGSVCTYSSRWQPRKPLATTVNGSRSISRLATAATNASRADCLSASWPWCRPSTSRSTSSYATLGATWIELARYSPTYHALATVDGLFSLLTGAQSGPRDRSRMSVCRQAVRSHATDLGASGQRAGRDQAPRGRVLDLAMHDRGRRSPEQRAHASADAVVHRLAGRWLEAQGDQWSQEGDPRARWQCCVRRRS